MTRPNDATPWETYAIEINLRKGGTTHPFLTLQFLTGGSYDSQGAVFITPNGRRKFLVASDHVESPLFRGYTPDDVFDLVVRRGLHFGQARQTGVVSRKASTSATPVPPSAPLTIAVLWPNRIPAGRSEKALADD